MSDIDGWRADWLGTNRKKWSLYIQVGTWEEQLHSPAHDCGSFVHLLIPDNYYPKDMTALVMEKSDYPVAREELLFGGEE